MKAVILYWISGDKSKSLALCPYGFYNVIESIHKIIAYSWGAGGSSDCSMSALGCTPAGCVCVSVFAF